ncbi:MAG TPA: laccase domain-containing protein [Candidatus Saccharimonadaceae bacterium]|nr:laccase domain-containing protein [Candidatus Saccharimonadaceae bacterium]
MIARDQPTIFPPEVVVRVSSVEDGTMSLRSLPEDPGEVWQNRKEFINMCGGDLDRTALVYITYEASRTYEEYARAETIKPGLVAYDDGIADGLLATSDIGLFLPVADCCAVVMYDTARRVMMMSHIGRQSIEVDGVRKSLDFMRAQANTAPHDIVSWLGPAVGKTNYPIYRRENRGLRELIVSDLEDAGVSARNIEVSPAVTDQNPDYFSHSEYKKSRRTSDGRFAVFAMMQK